MRYPLNRQRVKVGFGFGSAWFDTGKLHTGEDDQAVAGEAVYSMADGKVYNHTLDPKWGYGVVVDCGGWGFTIWHVNHLLPDGSQVKEGQQIASIFDLQGNTHMHWSTWVGSYDEYLRAGALLPAVFPDRFVEPVHFLASHQQPTPPPPTPPGPPDEEEPMYIRFTVEANQEELMPGLRSTAAKPVYVNVAAAEAGASEVDVFLEEYKGGEIHHEADVIPQDNQWASDLNVMGAMDKNVTVKVVNKGAQRVTAVVHQ